MSVTRPPNPQRVGSAADPAAAYRQLVAARRRNRRWRGGLVALAVIVVGLAVATAAISVANHVVHHGASHHSTAPPATSTSSTTTTTTPGTGNGPTISAISPNSGAPGDTVTISGTGLISPDGQITAYFGTIAAPTSCPNATTCSATVPAGGPGPVTVTVATGAGTSNGLSFDYV